jgi:hypothetical protein
MRVTQLRYHDLCLRSETEKQTKQDCESSSHPLVEAVFSAEVVPRCPEHTR